MRINLKKLFFISKNFIDIALDKSLYKTKSLGNFKDQKIIYFTEKN